MEIRETHLLVSADVEMMFSNGHVENFQVSDITCVWKWDETSRETAEYWAAFDYIAKHWTFDWFSIKSWTGSLVKKEGNLYEGIQGCTATTVCVRVKNQGVASESMGTLLQAKRVLIPPQWKLEFDIR